MMQSIAFCALFKYTHLFNLIFSSKEYQFNIKWDFLCFRPMPSLILVFPSSFLFLFQGPRRRRREYREDHLILLDFVGYYLCKLIVHHCLLWVGAGTVSGMSLSAAEMGERMKKISYDEKIIGGRRELVKYKNINNFPLFSSHRQQQFTHWWIYRRKSSEIFRIISFWGYDGRPLKL